jgi:hypothetical protein
MKDCMALVNLSCLDLEVMVGLVVEVLGDLDCV